MSVLVENNRKKLYNNYMLIDFNDQLKIHTRMHSLSWSNNFISPPYSNYSIHECYVMLTKHKKPCKHT